MHWVTPTLVKSLYCLVVTGSIAHTASGEKTCIVASFFMVYCLTLNFHIKLFQIVHFHCINTDLLPYT